LAETERRGLSVIISYAADLRNDHGVGANLKSFALLCGPSVASGLGGAEVRCECPILWLTLPRADRQVSANRCLSG
jgi:hypothetical protein